MPNLIETAPTQIQITWQHVSCSQVRAGQYVRVRSRNNGTIYEGGVAETYWLAGQGEPHVRYFNLANGRNLVGVATTEDVLLGTAVVIMVT